MFVNLCHFCCNKAPGFSLGAQGRELGVIQVVIAFITHFEWSFAENVLRMAYAFQSRNGPRVLWLCWAHTFLGRKWILGTVGTVSISHRHKKMLVWCLRTEGRSGSWRNTSAASPSPSEGKLLSSGEIWGQTASQWQRRSSGHAFWS